MCILKYLLGLFFCLLSVTVAAQNEFYYNNATDVIFRYSLRGSGGRALVHADGNELALNYGGDFTGGTRIGNSLLVENDGAIRIPDGRAFNGSYFRTSDYSTMTFVSRAWETVQGPNGKAFSFQTHNNAGSLDFEALAIYYGENGKIVMSPNGGNVGIGTNNPTEKLAVNGKIRAQEIKVENANWPDYVFTKDYLLPTLQQTEKHIKEKGHLPGIPSAAEVKANGIDLGEMNAKLLQKIEELTLHLIEMKKENQSIKSDYQELKKMMIENKSKRR